MCVLTRCARASSSQGGLSWLWPLNADGAPPIGTHLAHTPLRAGSLLHASSLHSALICAHAGWEAAQLYLVLPVALVISQYISTVLLPPTPPDADAAEDEATKNSKVLLKARMQRMCTNAEHATNDAQMRAFPHSFPPHSHFQPPCRCFR